MVDTVTKRVTICYVMGRSKRYVNAAQKQKAYRDRKRIQEKFGVPVERFESVEGSTPSAPKPTIKELRELIETESKRVVEEPVKPLIYRNDFGGIITERQWKTLQEKKRRAKEGGYILDEWSQ